MSLRHGRRGAPRRVAVRARAGLPPDPHGRARRSGAVGGRELNLPWQRRRSAEPRFRRSRCGRIGGTSLLLIVPLRSKGRQHPEATVGAVSHGYHPPDRGEGRQAADLRFRSCADASPALIAVAGNVPDPAHAGPLRTDQPRPRVDGSCGPRLAATLCGWRGHWPPASCPSRGSPVYAAAISASAASSVAAAITSRSGTTAGSQQKPMFKAPAAEITAILRLCRRPISATE